MTMNRNQHRNHNGILPLHPGKSSSHVLSSPTSETESEPNVVTITASMPSPPKAASSISNNIHHHQDDSAILLAPIHAKQQEQHEHQPFQASLCCCSNLSIITCLILTLGTMASGAFCALGITAARRDKTAEFHRVAYQYVKQLENDWTDYETAGLWTHQAMRRSTLDNTPNQTTTTTTTRTDFAELYENLLADGLEFQAICWLPNVTHAQRAAYEQEAQTYYAQKDPTFVYPGFCQYNNNDENDEDTFLKTPCDNDVGVHVVVDDNRTFYFPIQYIEPFEGNQDAIGRDMYEPNHVQSKTTYAITQALQTYQPTVSERLPLAHQTTDDAYGIFLFHPGIRISALPDMVSKDLSLMEIRIPALLKRTTQDFQADLTVYLFDVSKQGRAVTSPQTSSSSNPSSATLSTPIAREEQFLGGVRVTREQLVFLPERPLAGIQDGCAMHFAQNIRVADHTWTVVILADENAYRPHNNVFVLLGGILIWVGCLFLALWEWTSKRRTQKYNALQAQAQAERQALLAESGYRQRERDLNDYMAHEVRNPVAAALSAVHFVKEAVHAPQPLTPQQQGILQEDVKVVDNSLHFINDLLRNMLDMHRASSQQLLVDFAPTDILKDVLEPVHSMLHRNNTSAVRIVVACPENLIVYTDRLRLKQIVTNLGRNAVKFVERGFVKLCAQVVVVSGDKSNDGETKEHVVLSVEDSGCGVPLEKRDHLFEKFQSSLDSLSQGTGIGLYLSKDLSRLLGGRLYFDETYNSGIEGSPGSRFIIDLQTPPIRPEQYPKSELPHESNGENVVDNGEDSTSGHHTEEEALADASDLPSVLSVLFVDDDFILRRLFSRSIRKALPGWVIKEASNGETAILMAQEESFGIIFMDQYMSSVERQLLGTETVSSLRSHGVTSCICGLSANDMEAQFKAAGADAFLMKPFPCDPDALKAEMRRVLRDGNVCHNV